MATSALFWPVGLQHFVNQEGFSYTQGDTTIRSDVDVGPAKVRRRTTRSVDTLGFTIDVTFEQYALLKMFYSVTTNGGVAVFQFTDPVTRLPIDVRFTKPPQVGFLTGNMFRATCEVEVLP